MPLRDSVLPEFLHETGTTRKLLEVVPADRAAWKPHAKSMSLGQLALHLGEVPGWAGVIFKATEFDMAPPGGPAYQPTPFSTREALLATFDAKVAEAKALIEGAGDADFMVPWSLKKGGAIQMTLPRAAVFRTFVMNHMIHHRGQLTVYLRLLDVPLPGTYGPTADT